jgi:hypothetical protein
MKNRILKKDIIKEKDIIISQLKKYCPILRPFFELDMPLSKYSDTIYDFEVNKIHLQRQDLLKDKIKIKLEKLFGSNYKKELKINLDGGLILNIADHHQFINHPFLVSANIIGNVHKLLQPQKQEAIIVLSSGDVPPNNYFSKNGFQFHDKRVPIFSAAERELTSYYIPKRDFNFVERLKISKKWKDFNQQEQKFLLRECEKTKSFDYSRCTDYSDQISVIVKNTWPYIFEEKLRPNLPELIYLTQEEIVTDCLIDLLEEDNIISQCLFDEQFRNRILDNFRGNVAAWDEKEQKGTHFFWHKHPEKNQSLRMYIEGDKLVPTDKRFKNHSIALNKEVIIKALKKREIYPNLFTIFGVLNFYFGTKPTCGYGGLNYLDLMKQAWKKTLLESDMKKELALVEQVQITGLTAGLAIFFKKFDKDIKTLYAYDIFYEDGMSEEYFKKIFSMPYGDILSVGAADVYDYFSQKYIPKKEHIKPTINFDDLARSVFKWV